MKKLLALLVFGAILAACEQKKDAWRSLDLKEQEVFMEKAMKCYANESLGTDLK